MGADRKIYWIRANQCNSLSCSSDYEWAAKLRQIESQTRDGGRVCSWRYGWVAGWYKEILMTDNKLFNEDTLNLIRIIQMLEPTDFHNLPQLPLIGERVYELQLKPNQDLANKDCFVLAQHQSKQIIDIASQISLTGVLSFLQPRIDSAHMERTEDHVYSLVRGLGMKYADPDRHLVSSVIW